jgi:ligand-binding sensor domain-containing protein
MRSVIAAVITFALLLPLASLLNGCSGEEVVPPEAGPVWVTFKRPETPQLIANKVNDLHADQSGRVWIATDSGANYYHRGTWGVIRDSLRYSNGSTVRYKVNAIESGKSATIWFGLDGGGVKRYREGSSRAVWTTYFSELTYPVIQSISADKLINGDVWFATTFGVSRFIPSASDPEFGSWQSYVGPAYIPNNQVYASAIDFNDNNVWFGTQDGFCLYNDAITDWTTFALPPEYNYRINAIAFDLGGTAWLAKLVGVTSFNKKSGVWVHYTNENTGGRLPEGSVNAVTTDLGTTRWFGTDHGLVKLSDTTWTTFTTATTPELPGDVVTAVTYDNLGNLWIGTTMGIAVYNPEGTRF